MTFSNGVWSLPDLSDYGSGVPAFQECTSIGMGGFPVALTPARQIVLPTLTLPFKTSASLTPSSEGPAETTSTRPPTTSDTVTLPSRTPSPQQPDASPSTTVEPVPSQETTRAGSAIVTPTRPSSSSSRGVVTDDLPDNPQSSGSPVLPSLPASQDETGETINPVTVPAGSSSPSQPDAPRSSADPPSEGVPENSGSNSDSPPVVEYVVPSSASNPALGGTASAISIVRVSPTETPEPPNGAPASVVAGGDQPADQFASYIAAGISGGSVAVGEPDGNDYVLQNGATIAASEQAVVVSRTTFSALPSGSGVVAVVDGTSTTLTALPNASSTPPLRIPVAPDEDAEYVVQGGSTITAGGQAASVSGTMYSALPSNSGVLVVANGQSTTLAVASLPTPPPQNLPDAYILGGSLTISAGGSPQTISGTTYSALPSDSGILVVADGTTTTLAGTSIPGSDTAKAVNSYILDGAVTISAGGSVVAVSGITYSALPSGSGVVAIAGGKSSIVGEDGHLVSNATGGASQQDDVTPFDGGVAGSRAQLGSLTCRMIIVAAMLFARFVV
jgi:hypothetical protein